MILMSMLDSVIGGVVKAKQREKELSKSNRPMACTKQADDAGNRLILTEMHVSRRAFGAITGRLSLQNVRGAMQERRVGEFR
jgi:hypothetical protein